MNHVSDPDSPQDGDSPDGDPLDAAFAAYLKSCDSGEMPDRHAFAAQFPNLAEDLLKLMEAADLLDSVTPGEALAETRLLPTVPGDAETIDSVPFSYDEAQQQTLPLENRPAGDAGPKLPYRLGDYLLETTLGRGGMGVVYRAIQHPLQRVVAVKLIRSGMLATAAEVKRFFAEARAAARLHHPNIVSVFHFGHREGHHFFSMEYVEGTDLARKIQRSPLSPQDAARYVRDVARAIDYAHRHGVLHRDLKPANILIDQHDVVHITDFGLAKQIDTDSSLTGSGVALGTPSYMAPEQASGHSDRSGAAADIYSLGAILYAAVSGRPPFAGENMMQTLVQVVHHDPPRLRSLVPAVPGDLETICMKCLEKTPHRRYASAAALADDLDRFLQDRPIQARPRPALVRALHWIEAVPLVAALTGRRHLAEASPGHRRFQAGVLLLVMLLPLMVVGLFTYQQSQAQQMPDRVLLAGGQEHGVYNDFSQRLGERFQRRTGVPVQVFASGGSLDNRQRLLDGQVHLAPLQASAVSDDQLRVATPLFFEAAQVLVRERSSITSIEQLGGHSVAVGPAGSGSRLVAEYLFDSFGLDEAPKSSPGQQDRSGTQAAGPVRRRVIAWSELDAAPDIDAAVICIGVGSELVSRLLRRDWRLVPVPHARNVFLRHPSLHPMTILPEDFPEAEVPAGGIPTVGSTAFLVVRADAPDTLVVSALEAIYQPPALLPELINAHNAAEWQNLVFHPAARRYFAEQHHTLLRAADR
ncbi:serine/threonine-protein kinase [Roseimaritima sediminicola]|uniref:serine/threonine-protein kinase n=1 Tax=Roseimaritima sediminicola TaxID=2662066 RepID=UPI0012985377|nr:serine/threonine-protein kinase [Roseimaritima sediminicola]